MKTVRWMLYAAIAILYLLHNDLWLWHNPQLVMGLPVGLFFHVMYCVCASLLMVLLVNYAWPQHLEVETQNAEENPS